MGGKRLTIRSLFKRDKHPDSQTQDPAAHGALAPQTAFDSITPAEAAVLPKLDDPAPVPPTKAPIWSAAVLDFRTVLSDEYAQLETPGSEVGFDKLVLDQRLPQTLEAVEAKSNNMYVRRLKEWLPALDSTKDFSMTLAGLDPHKLAPYIVAGSFFVIELLFQVVPEHRRQAICEILCEDTMIILNRISYEETKMRHHGSCRARNVQDSLVKLKKSLQSLYTAALKLQAMIRKDARTDLRLIASTGIQRNVQSWKAALSEVKRIDKVAASHRDQIKDLIEAQDTNAEVLNYIEGPADLDPSHRTIMQITGMDNDQLTSTAGAWFIEEHLKPWLDSNPESISGRVLWLRGNGWCQTVSELQSHERTAPPNTFKVINYYCSARDIGAITEGPSQESVIRALCRKLAWLPDDSVSDRAIQFHGLWKGKRSSSSVDKPSLADWQDLLSELLKPSCKSVVLAVDALDECAEPEALLEALQKVVATHTSVRIVCSSRESVRVDQYFGDQRNAAPAVGDVEIMLGSESQDLSVFVDHIFRKKEGFQATKRSIFFENAHLRSQLRDALIEGASGMFRWVEIWLTVVFPDRLQDQVGTKGEAERYIADIKASKRDAYGAHQSLDKAYDALWTNNVPERRRELQDRAFHIILGTFEPMSLIVLTEALRIDLPGQVNSYADLAEADVEWLYRSFLVPNTKGALVWAHESARECINNKKTGAGDNIFESARNHLVLSQICLCLIGNIRHPAWEGAGFQFRDVVGARLYDDWGDGAEDKAHELLCSSALVEQHSSWKAVPESEPDNEMICNFVLTARAESFPNYTATRWLFHLRTVSEFDLTNSEFHDLLEQMISRRDSAVDAIFKVSLLAQAALNRVGAGFRFERSSWDKSLAFGKRGEQSARDLAELICWIAAGKLVFSRVCLLTLVDTIDTRLLCQALEWTKTVQHSTKSEHVDRMAFHVACSANSIKAATFLSEQKLGGNLITRDTLLWARDNEGQLPIHRAAEDGFYELVKLILGWEYDSNAESEGQLHNGARPRDRAEALLCYARDDYGNLPIHLAADGYYGGKNESSKKSQTVNVLLQYDAEHTTGPNFIYAMAYRSMVLAENILGSTPLHHASIGMWSGFVQKILDYERSLRRTQVKRTRLDTELGRRAHWPQTSMLYTKDPKGRVPAHEAANDLLRNGDVGTNLRIMLAHEHVLAGTNERASEGQKRDSALLTCRDNAGDTVFHEAVASLRYPSATKKVTKELERLMNNYNLYKTTQLQILTSELGEKLSKDGFIDEHADPVSPKEKDRIGTLLQRIEALPLLPEDYQDPTPPEPYVD